MKIDIKLAFTLNIELSDQKEIILTNSRTRTRAHRDLLYNYMQSILSFQKNWVS